MSSANVNVGFSNDRNSSRVLKPPGGGHTDIFNLKEPAGAKKESSAPAPDATASSKGGAAAAPAAGANPEAQQKRERVPPGGFSSGLW